MHACVTLTKLCLYLFAVMFIKQISFYLLCCLLWVSAEKVSNTKELAITNQEISASSTYKTTAVITALTAVAAGVVAVASWIIPLIAYKFCYLFGSCDDGLGSYVDQFLMGGRQNPFQKRSLDYLGPVLQTLANAYEIYEGGDPNDPKKNFKRGNFYRK